MAYICERCRRKNLRVMAVSHAKNRSHKTQRLNLHWARILVGGRIQRMRLCVKCIRTLKKGMKKKEEELKARMIAQQQALEEK